MSRFASACGRFLIQILSMSVSECNPIPLLCVVNSTEIDADSADLTVVVEGSSVFSGAEAFKKAKELRVLIDALKEAGIDENRVKLRSVEVNSQSFAIIKT